MAYNTEEHLHCGESKAIHILMDLLKVILEIAGSLQLRQQLLNSLNFSKVFSFKTIYLYLEWLEFRSGLKTDG